MPNVVAGPRLWFVSNAERPSDLVAKSADRLRLTRIVLGLDQVEMAEAVGVSSQRWSNWENGAHLPDLPVMVRAAARFGFSLDWIYRGAVDRLSHELAGEILRRRPDLTLGAPIGAEAAPNWDAFDDGRSGRRRRRSAA